jgi:hypothetical protein
MILVHQLDKLNQIIRRIGQTQWLRVPNRRAQSYFDKTQGYSP